MTHSFLLEIGLEELPAKVIVPAVTHLKDKVGLHFKENQLDFDSIETFSTPRRLAVKVTGLMERQSDKTETVRGPAKRIALDEEGNWSKAAIGFTKGQNASVEDIVFKEIKGEEYVFVEKHIKGQTAEDIIKRLSTVLPTIPFPVSMKWGNHSYKYIRPVHWLTALLDEQLVDMHLFDISSSRKSEGHRFLGETITLSHADDYPDALKEQSVIADRTERRNLIIKQIEALCETNGWESPLDNQELLEEVTDLVEYPTAFYGSFEESYLKVPESVLETAMADHQRYFPVRKDSEENEFLPYFIAVRNGNEHAIDQVRKGNEKVLSARLSDAAFFYNEDQKHSIDTFVDKLAFVSFHEKLGSLYDKQVRLTTIAKLLAPYFNVSKQQVDSIERAGMICKFDLVTQTVNEFTSLQGEIAGIFADERGEVKEVSNALGEQYLPKSMDGALPQTVVGAIISLADKLDSLLSFFSVDLIPSGSNDPFALRRQAMGIVRIIKAFDVSIPLNELLDSVIETVGSVETKAAYITNKTTVIIFIKDRVDQWLSLEAGMDREYDTRKAVLESNQDDILEQIETANVLKSKKREPDFKAIVESLTRVSNLAEKAQDNQSISSEQFETDSEKSLYEAILKAEQLIESGLTASEKWQILAEMHPLIDDFFEHNMVMTDDVSIKENRLALLSRINALSTSFARFNVLVIK